VPVVLTPFDDYPIHQTAAPVAQPASGDPNHYDRYFFNGHSRDGAIVFGAAMGHYPNRGVIDAAFSVVRDGVQHSVFASGAMPASRATAIGPVTVEVLEPMRTLRLTVDPNDTGIEADLTFRARTAVVEEPRQTVVRNNRLFMDVTRLTQWGTWEGTFTVAGETVDVGASADSETFGTRDRSWGVRPVGAQAPTNIPITAPQLFWLWAPLHFDDRCTHLARFEYADGTPWMSTSLVLPLLKDDEEPWGNESVGDAVEASYDLRWQRGRREMEAFTLHLGEGARREDIEFEPLTSFRMRGIGYGHPEWAHGSAHGPLAVSGEAIGVTEFDFTNPSTLHVQTVCRVRSGDDVGIGVLEQIAIGEHHPTGLRGIIDGYQPQGE